MRSLYLGQPTLRRVRAWLEASGLDPQSPSLDGPLFRPVTKSGLVGTAALSARSVRRIIQARAEAAGVEGRVSGHSLRVGAAQSLAQRVPLSSRCSRRAAGSRPRCRGTTLELS